MNSVVKKFLGVCGIWQLTAWAMAAQTTLNPGSLPLWFEAGPGGADTAPFVARGRDSKITISAEGVQFAFLQGQQTKRARMEFVGASGAAEVSGIEKLAAKINYFTGNDPARWQSGLDAFGQVRTANLYDGINVVYYGNQQRLEYDFDLRPGARPESIAIRFTGADRVTVNPQGELVVEVGGHQIIQHQPVAYQTYGNAEHPIPVGYKILDAHTVAFAVGHYNHGLTLVIDPVLSYSTFFGGNAKDIACSVALGTNDDSVYIAGQTLSTTITSKLSFATPGAWQTNFGGGGQLGDAFVAKFHDLGTNPAVLNNLATNLIYCTYLGGSGDDGAYALAVDPAGHAFVAGVTYSTNFPHIHSATNLTANGRMYNGSTNQAAKIDPGAGVYPSDAFISELDTNGASLIYSSLIGGESYDGALGLSLDPAGNAYVTGFTYSTNFPTTVNAYQTNFQAVYKFLVGCNAFVTEVSANGNTLNYSSYLGGTNVDYGFSIAYNNGYLAVAGSTCSSNFPIINPINQMAATTNQMAGGMTNNNYNGSVLNGKTNNINNSLQQAPFISDGFVSLFTNNLTENWQPLYSTFLGGTNSDTAYGVTVNSSGTVYVVGGTTSTNFPYAVNAGQQVLSSYLRTNNTGAYFTNGFITEIYLTNGATPVIGYSQLFGGIGNDVAKAVALDADGNVFIAGQANSATNLNATTNNLVGWLTATNSGANDVFVTALQSDLSSVIYSGFFGGSAGDIGLGLAVGPDDSAYVVGQTLSGPGVSIWYPVLNAWEPTPPDANNGFLTKIWLTPPISPALTASNAGTNLLISWSAVPLAQINTNTYHLETTTNLLFGAFFTNITHTTTPPTTNITTSAHWTIVTQKPFSTNQIMAGTDGQTYTNQGYTFTFNRTNQMRFFRLHGHSE